MKKVLEVTNEMRILREFIVEFCPFFTKEMADKMNYSELIVEIKEIISEL